MGRYFNPPTEENLNAAGRKLNTQPNFDSYKKLLKSGEILVGLFENRFKRAPELPDVEEFEEFMKQCRAGELKICDFYALPANHPNIK